MHIIYIYIEPEYIPTTQKKTSASLPFIYTYIVTSTLNRKLKISIFSHNIFTVWNPKNPHKTELCTKAVLSKWEFIKKQTYSETYKNWPELEESDDYKSVKATGVKNFIFSDAKSARNPRDRREEATEREDLIMEVNLLAIGEATSVVYGSEWGLFLEDGEEGESH